MGEKGNAHRLLVAKRPLGRLRWRWVDNVKMDLGEIGWNGVVWIGLAQDRNKWRALVNSIKCWETIKWLHNSWPMEYCSAA
jgi:hypothetical protein